MPTDWFNRLMLFLAGVLGAGGMAAAAASAHAGGAFLDPLALVALTQAPALLAFGLAGPLSAGLRAGAVVVALGAVLFTADLAARHFGGPHLFPYAAPAGGTAMIAGWVAVAICGILLRRPRSA
jgi:uncharacterized membrane protein YgdD (TMEM256/DUF423 family)